MTENTPRLAASVCIVSWNVCGYLKQCLTHLHQDFGAFELEIIVADNHSHDGSGEMVRTQFPRVRLIQNGFNAGFAQAANQAIRAAGYETIVLLNPDTIANPEAVRVMLETLEAKARKAIVSCRKINGNGEPAPDLGVNFSPFASTRWQLMKCSLALAALSFSPRFEAAFTRQCFLMETALAQPLPETDAAFETTVVSGCVMAFTKSAFDRIGGFDERFFFMQEDVDFCLRARALGYRVMMCPNVHIIHYVNKSLEQWDQQAKLSAMTYARYQLIRKYNGRIGLLAWVGATLASRWVVKGLLQLIPNRRDLRTERDTLQIMFYHCYGIDAFDGPRNALRVLLNTPTPISTAHHP